MADYAMYDGLFADSPEMYFSTTAGPAEDDLYGPPSNVLSIYGDGSPIMRSENRIAADMGRGGAVHTNFFHRGDVQAGIILIIGVWMVHQYVTS
jgi:hypothetical protein